MKLVRRMIAAIYEILKLIVFIDGIGTLYALLPTVPSTTGTSRTYQGLKCRYDVQMIHEFRSGVESGWIAE
jgi:hypothetical protein